MEVVCLYCRWWMFSFSFFVVCGFWPSFLYKPGHSYSLLFFSLNEIGRAPALHGSENQPHVGAYHAPLGLNDQAPSWRVALAPICLAQQGWIDLGVCTL